VLADVEAVWQSGQVHQDGWYEYILPMQHTLFHEEVLLPARTSGHGLLQHTITFNKVKLLLIRRPQVLLLAQWLTILTEVSTTQIILPFNTITHKIKQETEKYDLSIEISITLHVK
jgi:hypothetical protein